MAKKEWINETLDTLKVGNRVWRAQVVTSPTGAKFLALKAFKPKAEGGTPLHNNGLTLALDESNVRELVCIRKLIDVLIAEAKGK